MRDDRASRVDAHFRALTSEIWNAIEDEDDAGGPGRAAAEAMQALKAASEDIVKSVGAMGGQHKAMAEQLAGVLADVVGIVKSSHDGLKEAVELSAAHAIAREMTSIRETMAADAKRHQQMLGAVTVAIDRMSKTMDGLVESMVSAMTAPRHIVTDSDGKPVGVRIGR